MAQRKMGEQNLGSYKLAKEKEKTNGHSYEKNELSPLLRRGGIKYQLKGEKGFLGKTLLHFMKKKEDAQ